MIASESLSASVTGLEIVLERDIGGPSKVLHDGGTGARGNIGEAGRGVGKIERATASSHCCMSWA